jgi:hypothetical protein
MCKCSILRSRDIKYISMTHNATLLAAPPPTLPLYSSSLSPSPPTTPRLTAPIAFPNACAHVNARTHLAPSQSECQHLSPTPYLSIYRCVCIHVCVLDIRIQLHICACTNMYVCLHMGQETAHTHASSPCVTPITGAGLNLPFRFRRVFRLRRTSPTLSRTPSCEAQ